MLVPVILCGGGGTRLWPLSSQALPKQFLPLLGEQESLFQAALARTDVTAADTMGRPLLVAGAKMLTTITEQLPPGMPVDLLVEPVGRNTAPAILAAALHVAQHDADAVLWIMPADHFIAKPDALLNALPAAVAAARDNYFVTFGIQPTRAATAYGYIQAGASILDQVSHVKRFKEKPDSDTAQAYLASGEYLWNSGIFVVTARHVIAAMQRFAPSIYQAVTQAVTAATTVDQVTRLDSVTFADSPADSIDYAVLERSERAAVIPLHMPWHDVGSWDSLANVLESDSAGNVLHGPVVTHAVTNSFVKASSRPVMACGVADAVIVETPDGVLVTHRDQAEMVKQLIGDLPVAPMSRVHRPWGWYQSISQGSGFQVKLIAVDPGQQLSLQSHAHRSEHWVVVAGSAEIVNGDTTATYTVNESVYIPVGDKHRLSNFTDEMVMIVEVQVGSYLGEDDIVRYEDIYNRD